MFRKNRIKVTLSDGSEVCMSKLDWHIYRSITKDMRDLKYEIISSCYPNGRIIYVDGYIYFEYTKDNEIFKARVPYDCLYFSTKIDGDYYLNCLNRPENNHFEKTFKVVGKQLINLPENIKDAYWQEITK